MTDQSRAHGNRKRPPSFIAEIFHYLKTQKRWWLTPIIVVLALLAVVALLAGLAPVLPFIYTLFLWGNST